MKVCTKCKTEKPYDKYRVDKHYKDGYVSICKDCKKNIDKNYSKRNSNKEYIKTYLIEWRKNHPNYYNEKNKIYQKQRKQKDIVYKISSNIRTRISQSISGYSKSKTTLQILGINNFNEFKTYIESLFSEGMTWENYGYGPNKWVIDHRKPLASAVTEQDVYNLNHYTNLQPMWWNENMVKGAKVL
jgi:NAD-dependent SIR2 family protein deacetylase